MSMKPVGVAKVPVIDLQATGCNIVRLRKQAGLSVRDLQTIMGFTNPQAIYKWQNGCCLPSIDNLVILAAALGTTIDDILVYEDEQSDDAANQNEQISNWRILAIQLNNKPAQYLSRSVISSFKGRTAAC